MDAFKKTIKISLLKFALGGINLAVCSALFALLFGVGNMIGEDVSAVLMLIWIIVAAALSWFVFRYVGYSLRVGHMAAMYNVLLDGEAPTDIRTFCSQAFKNRFGTPATFFSCERLTGESMSQLQPYIDRVAEASTAQKLFNSVALGYIKSCCISYAFYNEQINCFRSAAEGIVIYYRNSKKLFKNSLSIFLLCVIPTFIIFILGYVLMLLLFKAIPATHDLALFIALFFAALITLAVKVAFIDSLLLVITLERYLSFAPYTEINTEIIGRLCSGSTKYRELFTRARKTPDPVIEHTPEPPEAVLPVQEYDEEALRKYTGEMPVVEQKPKGKIQRQNPTNGVKHSTAKKLPNARYKTSTGAYSSQSGGKSYTPSIPQKPEQSVKAPEPEPQKQIFCPECGYKNAVGSKFCENCGSKL